MNEKARTDIGDTQPNKVGVNSGGASGVESSEQVPDAQRSEPNIRFGIHEFDAATGMPVDVLLTMDGVQFKVAGGVLCDSVRKVEEKQKLVKPLDVERKNIETRVNALGIKWRSQEWQEFHPSAKLLWQRTIPKLQNGQLVNTNELSDFFKVNVVAAMPIADEAILLLRVAKEGGREYWGIPAAGLQSLRRYKPDST